MSHTIAFALPLPVALALAVLMFGLLGLSALVLSLRKPAPVHLPAADWDDAAQSRPG